MNIGLPFVLSAFTDDPDLAAHLDVAGVDRIGPDLERYGKLDRQANLNTRISEHRAESLIALRPVVRRAKLLARIDPFNPGSAAQIDQVLGFGAEVIMLPYFREFEEVRAVHRLIAGRAAMVPLIETEEALALPGEIAALGIEEVYFGLNDLRIARGYDSFLPVFGEPVFEAAVAAARDAGLRYQIAGLARPDDNGLPVDPALVYRNLRRLGASGSLIARSFVRDRDEWHRLPEDVAALRAILAEGSPPHGSAA